MSTIQKAIELAQKTGEMKAKVFCTPPLSKVKKRKGLIRMRVQAGKATSGPPIGPMFGAVALKSIDFVKQFNAATEHVKDDLPLRAKAIFYDDRSYDVHIMPPQASRMVQRAAQARYLGYNGSCFVGYVTPQMLYHVAELTSLDHSPEGILKYTRVLAAGCRIWGIRVVDHDTPTMRFKEEAQVEKQDELWVFESPSGEKPSAEEQDGDSGEKPDEKPKNK
eukprot:RCo016534